MTLLRPWRLPPRRVVLWYAVSAVPLTMVVLLGAFLSYHYHALTIQSREREDRAYEVIDTVHRVVLGLARASVAERNFVILGDPASLVPLKGASADAADFARLSRLLSDSPEQLARLEALRQRSAAAWTELSASIELRQSAGFEPARAALAAGDANLSFEEMRRSAAELASAERSLLGARQALRRDQERSVLRMGVLIAFLSVITRLFIAWLLARLRKRGLGQHLVARTPNTEDDNDEELSAQRGQ